MVYTTLPGPIRPQGNSEHQHNSKHNADKASPVVYIYASYASPFSGVMRLCVRPGARLPACSLETSSLDCLACQCPAGAKCPLQLRSSVMAQLPLPATPVHPRCKWPGHGGCRRAPQSLQQKQKVRGDTVGPSISCCGVTESFLITELRGKTEAQEHDLDW